MTITQGNEMIVANTQVVCKLRLQVTPTGEPAFEADTSARFSQFAIPGQGDVLEVLYDPEDHDKVVVDQSAGAQVQTMDKHVQEAAQLLGLGSGPVIAVNGQIVSAGGAAAPAPTAPDPVDEIRKLADLRDRGALTQAEFDAQKAKLLERL